MPRIAMLALSRPSCAAALLLAAACGRGAPAGDTASAPNAGSPVAAAPSVPSSPVASAPVDTAAPNAATPPAASSPTPAAPPRVISPRVDSAPRPSATDTTPTRPRMVPRPPRPVPLPMPGRENAPAIQPAGGDQASDQAALDRLRQEARALVKTDGCTAADQCAVMPVGVRGCGGRSEYLVYCPRSTDVAALRRKVAEIDRADRAFNTKYQVMSTCELRTAPTAQLVGGACQAAAPSSPR